MQLLSAAGNNNNNNNVTKTPAAPSPPPPNTEESKPKERGRSRGRSRGRVRRNSKEGDKDKENKDDVRRRTKSVARQPSIYELAGSCPLCRQPRPVAVMAQQSVIANSPQPPPGFALIKPGEVVPLHPQHSSSRLGVVRGGNPVLRCCDAGPDLRRGLLAASGQVELSFQRRTCNCSWLRFAAASKSCLRCRYRHSNSL